MEVNLVEDSASQKTQFGRLGTLYIVALSAIALVAIIGQVLIQLHLRRQLSDSEVVNVAGRQRMLSQIIAKETLNLSLTTDTILKREAATRLRSGIEEWKRSQQQLISGDNTTKVKDLFNSIDVPYRQIIVSVDSILGSRSSSTIQLAQKTIHENEHIFL